MTSADHNKILGIIHLAYGGLQVIVLIGVSLFILSVFGVLAVDRGAAVAAPMGVVVLVMAFVLAINFVFLAPSFLAGYGMLKRKSWGRGAGIVAAIVDALNFPIGTAVCVYSLWFLLGEQGKQLYDKQFRALPPPPPQWSNSTSKPVVDYEPPVSPPDWR